MEIAPQLLPSVTSILRDMWIELSSRMEIAPQLLFEVTRILGETPERIAREEVSSTLWLLQSGDRGVRAFPFPRKLIFHKRPGLRTSCFELQHKGWRFVEPTVEVKLERRS
jgi:hypothetical protein